MKIAAFIVMSLLFVGCADRQPIDPATRAMLFQYVMSRPVATPNYVQYDPWQAIQPQICYGCW